MKIISVFVVSLYSIIQLSAQTIPAELEGKWLGTLDVGIKLRIVFNFEIEGDTIYSTLDSPDQSAYGIWTQSTTYQNGDIKIEIPLIGANYTGHYNADSNLISGMFFQGATFPLNLTKVDTVEPIKRPQNPGKPYPYKSEAIVFENHKTDSVMLAGTLTIPEGSGPFHAVILVTGSGPQNRDEFLLGHAPFLVLSDYLTRKNIIVLRYDDRGCGESSGDFKSATSADFASDADAAVNYLFARKEELHIDQIGIAGHSEGGLIAPITANENKHVDFIVLLAGPGIPGDSILNLQGDLIAKSEGMNDTILSRYRQHRKNLISIVKTETDFELMKLKLIEANKKFIRETDSAILKQMSITQSDTLLSIDFYANPWMKYFLSYDPRPILEKTKIPVLAINGTEDVQVPYKENLSAIESALTKANNKQFEIKPLEGLNHLFQRCETCSVSEYAQLEETFNEEAMKIVAGFILSLK